MRFVIQSNTINDNYWKELSFIEGKQYTPREIDVISCLLCGNRKTKLIAEFLAISPRTVDTHITHVMEKMNCHTRENIVTLLSSSDKYERLKQHHYSLLPYQALSSDKIFENVLKEIRYLIPSNFTHIKLLYEANINKKYKALISNLLFHIECLGLLGTSMPYNNKEITEQLLRECINVFDGGIIYVLDEDKTGLSFSPIERIIGYPRNKNEPYYFTLQRLLNFFFPHVTFDENILNFNKKEEQESFIQTFNITSNLIEPETKKNSVLWFFNWRYFFQRTPSRFIGILSFMASVFVGDLLLKIFKTSVETEYFINYKNSIRSEFIIPNEYAFLTRSLIMQKINTQLKNTKKDSINTIGLVGIGGAGKTMLARHYAKLYKGSIVWELNATTSKTLMNSFYELALELAKNEEQKEKINLIKSIKDDFNKDKEILAFVKDSLKASPDWLLIYDNCESFETLKTFFPSDENVWGNGNIIVTTRDSTLAHFNHIKADNVIYMEQLKMEEATLLFCKIYFENETEEVSNEKSKEIQKLLTYIPRFPLDVALAAYYIKYSSIKFEEYINECVNDIESFNEKQKNVAHKSINSYRTRYDIVKDEVSKLIKVNPVYKDLLVLICRFNPHEIPLDHLKSYYDPILIDEFVHELKKYSLINNRHESGKNNISFYKYIHFIIQKILLESRNQDKEALTTLLETYAPYHLILNDKEQNNL